LVTGSVVAIIGLNLAGTVVSDAINSDLRISSGSDWIRLMIAAVTFFTAALVSIRLRGFLQLIPILIGVMFGCAVAAACGMLDPQKIALIWMPKSISRSQKNLAVSRHILDRRYRIRHQGSDGRGDEQPGHCTGAVLALVLNGVLSIGDQD
jgi:hypothetical protein